MSPACYEQSKEEVSGKKTMFDEIVAMKIKRSVYCFFLIISFICISYILRYVFLLSKFVPLGIKFIFTIGYNNTYIN